MAIAIPLRALLPYALGAATYLFRLLLPESPPTEPVGTPYNPPFAGGQCAGIRYFINVSVTQPRVGRTATTENDYQFSAFGAITNVQVAFNSGGSPSLFFTGKDSTGAIFNSSSAIPNLLSNEAFVVNSITLVRADGSSTECGNVGNPTPTKPISETGVADSGSPNLDNDDVVQEGIAVTAIPSFLSALLAALQAAKSAADALAGVRAIADAIAALADLLNGLKDNADKDKKDKDKNNKEISRHDFGSIRYDGYLRLYPSTGNNEKEALYIDLQLLSIPIYYGKYFGRKSPNFYRFKSLGYISFTSPTFGIIETKEIEFSRLSLNVPANASGFFYHLGLEGDIIGNISAFYIKAK